MNKQEILQDILGDFTFSMISESDIYNAMDEYARRQSITFASWLQHTDNGTEHYNPHTKQTSKSIGFSPFDCFIDELKLVPELYDSFIQVQKEAVHSLKQ